MCPVEEHQTWKLRFTHLHALKCEKITLLMSHVDSLRLRGEVRAGKGWDRTPSPSPGPRLPGHGEHARPHRCQGIQQPRTCGIQPQGRASPSLTGAAPERAADPVAQRCSICVQERAPGGAPANSKYNRGRRSPSISRSLQGPHGERETPRGLSETQLTCPLVGKKTLRPGSLTPGNGCHLTPEAPSQTPPLPPWRGNRPTRVIRADCPRLGAPSAPGPARPGARHHLGWGRSGSLRAASQPATWQHRAHTAGAAGGPRSRGTAAAPPAWRWAERGRRCNTQEGGVRSRAPEAHVPRQDWAANLGQHQGHTAQPSAARRLSSLHGVANTLKCFPTEETNPGRSYFHSVTFEMSRGFHLQESGFDNKNSNKIFYFFK